MRLIDADALKERAIRVSTVKEHCYFKAVGTKEIDRAPTVDAELVKHGRWIMHNKGQNNWCECSECNTVGSPFWKRCPLCEAKMDGV